MFLKCNVGCKRLFLSSVILSLILGSAASFGGVTWICLGCFEEYELDYQNKKTWRLYPSCENKKCSHNFPNCPKKMYDALTYKKKHIIADDIKKDIRLATLCLNNIRKNDMKVLEDEMKNKQVENGIKLHNFFEGMTEEFIQGMEMAVFEIFFIEIAIRLLKIEGKEITLGFNIENGVEKLYKVFTKRDTISNYIIAESLSIASFMQGKMYDKVGYISTLLSVGSEVDEEVRYQQQTDNIVQYMCQLICDCTVIMSGFSNEFDCEENKILQGLLSFRAESKKESGIYKYGEELSIFYDLPQKGHIFWERYINSAVEEGVGLDILKGMEELITGSNSAQGRQYLKINKVIMFSGSEPGTAFRVCLCREVKESSQKNRKTCEIKWCFGPIVVEVDPTLDSIDHACAIANKIKKAEKDYNKAQKEKKEQELYNNLINISIYTAIGSGMLFVLYHLKKSFSLFNK